MSEINISNLNKAEVLAALYNNARPFRAGCLTYKEGAMTSEQAQALLDGGQTSFDYLDGRVMKVSLAGDTLDPWLYDRDNGEGAAWSALSGLMTNAA